MLGTRRNTKVTKEYEGIRGTSCSEQHVQKAPPRQARMPRLRFAVCEIELHSGRYLVGPWPPIIPTKCLESGLKKKESGPGHTWGGEAASAQEMAASAKRT